MIRRMCYESLVWNCTGDLLQIQGNTLSDDNTLRTKRGVLKVIGKIFDPLGLITPVLLYDKESLYCTRIVERGTEPLPEMLHKRWTSVLKKLK